MSIKQAKLWAKELGSYDAEKVIEWGIKIFGENKIMLSSSLGLEDQVITHMLMQINRNVKIFTLDTGRHFQETYFTMEKTEDKYNFRYKVYFSDYKQVEKMVNKKGINLFYDSIENRKLCCYVRKILPLKRALKNLECWICGLRREQGVTRQSVNVIEWDSVNGLYKLNPLYNWSIDRVWNFIRENKIPYNKLHDEGYPSIGCAPCTRAIKEGENIRDGRWWWENPEHKECGLHRRKIFLGR